MTSTGSGSEAASLSRVCRSLERKLDMLQVSVAPQKVQ